MNNNDLFDDFDILQSQNEAQPGRRAPELISADDLHAARLATIVRWACSFWGSWTLETAAAL